MSDPTIPVERTDDPPATIVAPAGPIDMSNSPELRHALRSALENGTDRLVVDLSGVEYMDSSGLATLVEAMRSARAEPSVPMVICCLNETVRAVFEIARLDQFFEITDSRDEAVRAG